MTSRPTSSGTVARSKLFSPQATTVPSDFNAKLCHGPASIATTPLAAAGGTAVWPSSLLPHALTVPRATVSCREDCAVWGPVVMVSETV